MTTMAARSSRMAMAVRRTLSEIGARLPTSARMPRAKAMSVAAGIAQTVQGERVVAVVDGDVDRGGEDEAADGAEARQQGLARRGQLPVDELALDLEADQQEKHGHQAVVDPQQQRFREPAVADANLERDIQQVAVDGRKGRVGQHDGNGGGGAQQETGGCLVPHEFTNGVDGHLGLRFGCRVLRALASTREPRDAARTHAPGRTLQGNGREAGRRPASCAGLRL